MNSLRIAWRNIWRNGRRTAVTVAAIAFNTAILIATYGLMEGMILDTVHNVTHLVIGDVQVHAPEYRADRSFYRDIPDPERILAEAERLGLRAAPRSYGYGLVSVGHKSAGAEFWGVEPGAERSAFELASSLLEGEFLSPMPEASTHLGRPVREIVLGRKLAKSLHAELGSEIIAVVQAGDGSLGNELFTVRGILKTCGEEIDRGAAILHRSDFQDLFVSGGRVHEIAINAKGEMSLEQVATAIAPVAGGMEIKSWQQLMPPLADMVNMFDAVMIIFGLVFFLAAGLGVLNTMLMATFERIREFGVLKALGATPWRILRDVSTEAFVLALFSTAIGVGVGVGLMAYFHTVGLDMSFAGGDITFSGVAFNTLWRSTFDLKAVVWPTIIMWIVCVLAALYPASKAARIDPVRAMTHV
jgi:ABC-type lipoprotein release transport system permease subunit